MKNCQILFQTPLQLFTSLSLMVSKHMAKFEFRFDSYGEEYGIKTFLNKRLSTRLGWNVKDYVVIWFEYAKVSNYDLPKNNTTNS